MKNTIFYFKQLILSFLLCFVAIWANAQNQVVKGTVKDIILPDFQTDTIMAV